MRESNIDWLPPVLVMTNDLTRGLAVYPGREANRLPYGAQDDALTNRHVARAGTVFLSTCDT